MTIISVSFTAVAKLGVPPGKWFCLARTGLGYGRYSCCVCGAHHDAFMEGWKQEKRDLDWTNRLNKAVEYTLQKMQYYEPSLEKPDRSGDIQVIKERIQELVFNRENYIVHPTFAEIISNPAKLQRVRIITDGPRCIVNNRFPEIPDSQIITGKSSLSEDALASLSDFHIGTNISDLRLPQTKLIVGRKLTLPPGRELRIVPRLTPADISQLFE